MRDHSLLLCSLALVFLLSATGIRALSDGDDIVVYAKSLKSLRTALSYEYYSLPFCQPTGGAVTRAIGLGDVLKSHRLVSSPYHFQLPENEHCKVACKLENIAVAQAKKFQDKIEKGYVVHMSVDGIPVAELGGSRMDMKTIYHQGFPLGKVQGGQYVIFNHLQFDVYYYGPPGRSSVIKAVIVTHSSIPHNVSANGSVTCSAKGQMTVEPGSTIYFTYDVQFHAGKNAMRMDTLAAANTPLRSYHWSSIYNAFLFLLLLSFIVSALARRTLHANIPGYSQLATQDEARELFDETGWKVLHGDVLRPPSHGALFSVFIGTGVQILTTASLALILATFGLVNPALDGRLEMALPILWVLAAPLAGHAASRLSLSFKRSRRAAMSSSSVIDSSPPEDWWHVPLGVALGFPSLVFIALLVANIAKAGQGAIALPVGTVFGIVALWALAVGATLAGGGLALPRKTPEDPFKTNMIPRPIPAQPWYLWAPCLLLVGGAVPFLATWGEVSLFIKAPFLADVNPVSFHLFQIPLLFLIFAEVAVLLSFVQLARENYLWWWTSFLGVGSCGLYAFGWATYVFAKNSLRLVGTASAVAFFSNACILSIALFFASGTIGFYFSHLFVRHLYSTVPQ